MLGCRKPLDRVKQNEIPSRKEGEVGHSYSWTRTHSLGNYGQPIMDALLVLEKKARKERKKESWY